MMNKDIVFTSKKVMIISSKKQTSIMLIIQYPYDDTSFEVAFTSVREVVLVQTDVMVEWYIQRMKGFHAMTGSEQF